jgi:hypothetical protein
MSVASPGRSGAGSGAGAAAGGRATRTTADAGSMGVDAILTNLREQLLAHGAK